MGGEESVKKGSMGEWESGRRGLRIGLQMLPGRMAEKVLESSSV